MLIVFLLCADVPFHHSSKIHGAFADRALLLFSICCLIASYLVRCDHRGGECVFNEIDRYIDTHIKEVKNIKKRQNRCTLNDYNQIQTITFKNMSRTKIFCCTRSRIFLNIEWKITYCKTRSGITRCSVGISRQRSDNVLTNCTFLLNLVLQISKDKKNA